VPSLWHAIYAHESKVIVAISGQNKESSVITIFEMNGKKRISVQEPEGMHFNCIGENRGKDVAVMAKVYKSGWLDWWYSVNPTTGELSSLGEGR